MLLFFTLLFTQSVGAQDSISVLFIGNSYTYVNDLPTLFSQLSGSLGKTTTIQSQTQGGATFGTHAGNSATYVKIHEQPWDYVVLQGQSQEPSFPDDQVDQQSIPPAMQIADSVYSAKFCTELMLFMTWGRQNGDPQWQPISTYEGMQQRLRDGYMRIADSCEASVSPVGMAWKYVRDNHPEINLYNADESHPSLEGSYLAACTFYAALFRSSPVGATYTAGLSTTVTTILQEAAAVAVLDSMDTWHLRASEEHTVAAFTYNLSGGNLSVENESRKAQSYAWSFGDGATSQDEHPTHSYIQTGNYTVQLVAISECGNDTTTVQLSIDFLGISTHASNDFQLKTWGNGQYELIAEQSSDKQEWKVVNILGQEVGSGDLQQLESGSLFIDLSNQPKGMYFLSDGNTSIRLMR